MKLWKLSDNSEFFRYKKSELFGSPSNNGLLSKHQFINLWTSMHKRSNNKENGV